MVPAVFKHLVQKLRFAYQQLMSGTSHGRQPSSPRSSRKQLPITAGLKAPQQRTHAALASWSDRARCRMVFYTVLLFPPGIWYNILRGVGKLAVIINVSDLGTSTNRSPG